MSTTENPPVWADSKESWLGRVHEATLVSGMKVVYRDLTLAEMVRLADDLPSDLVEIAIAEWAQPGASGEMAFAPFDELPDKPTKKQAEQADKESRQVLERVIAVNRHLVAASLVAPQLTVDELDLVPAPDLELLSNLINRRVITDAVGRHVGVVPLDQFRVFAEAHGHEPCPADCQACESVLRALATAR